VLTVVEGGAETIALAEGLGLDPALLIEESARRRELDVPLCSTIRRRLAEGAKDHGDEDMSATYWTSAPGQDGGAAP
jgi:3-hydroxyisobutyrate dehydrogenase